MFSLSGTIFIFLFFGGIFSAVVIDPSFGLLAYVLDYFIHPRIRWWFVELPELRYSYIAALSVLIGYALRYHRYRLNRIFVVAQNKWLLAQTLLLLFISLIAIDFDSHRILVLRYLKYIVIYFLIVLIVDNKQKFERLIGVYLFGCTYTSYVGWELGRTVMERLERIGPSDASDANTTAAVIVTSVPLLLFYISEGKKWQKLLSLVSFAFCINLLVLTNSRGGFLALIISTFYFAVQMIRASKIRKKYFTTRVVVLVILAVSSVWYLGDNLFWNRMSTIKSFQTSGDMGGHRDILWKAGVEMSLDYPQGTGGNGYQSLSPMYLSERMIANSRTGTKAAHSLWVEALVENGYLGLLLIVGYVISIFKSLSKVKARLCNENQLSIYLQAISLESSLVAYLCAASFLSVFYSELLYLLPAFIAAFCLINSVPEEGNA